MVKVKQESSPPADNSTSPPNKSKSGSSETLSAVNDQKAKPASDKPKAFTIKYKRPRGSRACVVCRSRKVRCDAEIHIPCTNCITFGCDCTLPEAKKRGNSAGDVKAKKRQTNSVSKNQEQSNIPSSSNSAPNTDKFTPGVSKSHQSSEKKNSNGDNTKDTQKNNIESKSKSDHPASNSEPVLNISQVSVPPSLTSNYKTRPLMHKRDINDKNSGGHKASLTFLGSSSISLVTQKVGQNHVQLAEDIFDVSENSLDSVELEILKLRGAFLLPSKELALDLINIYFERVHPLMPVINRSDFMKKFNHPTDKPSLMLLQAVLLCGCRVSSNPLLLDSKGSNNLASLTFFRRAKALYETNYESDPVSIIQTVILIGSYWEGPEDVTRNSFYWTRVAVGLAQGFGFQRDISNSPTLSSSEKKIWRRIWWCLFEKDRNVAIAFGRPTVIDLNDCDVPMLTMDDFNEDDDETNEKSAYPVDETQALYFIHLVKLAEITGIIIKHQYTVKAEQMKRKNKFSIIQHCDMLMGIWFTNLPPQLVFTLTDSTSQNFYSSLLNAQYYNRLYLIHRANLLRMAKSSSTNPNNYKYPSWGISFQAARMISIVSKILLDKGHLKYCPAMFVYILFSSLMMLIYHVDSPNSVVASTALDSLFISRAVLKELTLYWPIAGVLMKLFDKYANDKFKRAKVIENGTKMAELEELNASKNVIKTQNDINNYYGNDAVNSVKNGNGDFIPKHQNNNDSRYRNDNQHKSDNSRNTSYVSEYSVSPGSIIPDHQSHQQHTSQSTSHQLSSLRYHQQQQPQQQQQEQPHQQLHQQQKKQDESSHINTSPSSTNSFPDISLVTENLPTNQNFYENFEPTQLFPNVNFSIPPTRSHSPNLNQGDTINEESIVVDSNNTNAEASTEANSNSNLNPLTVGSNIYGTTANVPTTPGEAFSTNFIDSSFLNMNLQASGDVNLNDELGSLFNFQI